MAHQVAAGAECNQVAIRVSPGFAKIADAFKDMVLAVMNLESIGRATVAAVVIIALEDLLAFFEPLRRAEQFGVSCGCIGFGSHVIHVFD